MNISTPLEVEQDTKAIFPMPPCEIREALANGVAEAVRRSLRKLGDSYNPDEAEDLADDLTLILFGDLNADFTQAPRGDGRFLDLQDVFKRAITLDDIAKRLKQSKEMGAPQKAILRIEPVPDQSNSSVFYLHIELQPDEIPAEPAIAN